MEIRVFVNGRTDWLGAFQTALEAQCRALQLTLPLHTDHTVPLPPNGLVLYFGKDGPLPTSDEMGALEQCLKEGHTVLPVVATADSAKDLPESLGAINAFLLDRYQDSDWPAALVDEVLALCWLRRRTRRMFISYRRVDSEAVAHQLHTHFVKLGFDVFLDDCSIAHGVHFQSELMWRLNDVDMVLLLVSPQLCNSKWVMAEIAAANTLTIGMLGVRWPLSVYAGTGLKEPLERDLYVDQQYRLEASDLQGDAARPREQTLSDSAIDRITSAVHARRAQAIRMRLVSLLPFAEDELAPQFNVTHLPRLGDLQLVDRKTGEEVFARVLPFRPTVDTLHALHDEAAGQLPPPSAVGCFYAENEPGDVRIRALRWLLEAERPKLRPSRHLLWTYPGK